MSAAVLLPALFSGLGVVVLGALVALGKRIRHRASAVDTFLRDWNGEPSRPGVPTRPGVMVRLHYIETSQGEMRGEIAEIRAQVTPNSGSSMRDAVARIHHAATGNPDPGLPYPPDPAAAPAMASTEDRSTSP